MQTITHIYYIFSGRFPSEKAHALYAAKVCDSLAKKGFTVTLVVPRRLGRSRQRYTEFFQMPDSFSVRYIPTIDLYFVPGLRVVAFYLHYFFFSLSASLFCFAKARKQSYFITNEGTVSFLCSFFSSNLLYEVHDYPHSGKIFFRLLFGRVPKILTQNTIKRDLLVEEFAVKKENIIVEQNAITLCELPTPEGASKLRIELAIAQDAFVVMYTGQLIAWKGVHTLAKALCGLPSNMVGVFLGGSVAQVEAFREEYKAFSNIHILGHKPIAEIAKWQSMADCLVLPNTAHEKISSLYTSPMKLFEYMTARRPIIASDIPSIREIVDEEQVFFVAPDDVDALRDQISFVRDNTALSQEKAKAAYAKVQENTWEKRADRICKALAIVAS